MKKGSGTTPHKHIDPFDKNYNITNQKFSLVYYLSIGDQNCSEPGILKLYDPEKELLPSKGLIVIFLQTANIHLCIMEKRSHNDRSKFL